MVSNEAIGKAEKTKTDYSPQEYNDLTEKRQKQILLNSEIYIGKREILDIETQQIKTKYTIMIENATLGTIGMKGKPHSYKFDSREEAEEYKEAFKYSLKHGTKLEWPKNKKG